MDADSRSGSGDKKLFIIDTSVLVHDPAALSKFRNNDIVVPIWVIEEIDNLKSHHGEKGANSRAVSRWLEPLTVDLDGGFESGIKTPGGGLIFIDHNGKNFSDLPAGLENSNDNRLILIARDWQKKNKYSKIVIVSKDLNLRIKARAMGVIAEDYESDKAISRISDLYSGREVFQLEDRGEELAENFYRNKFISSRIGLLAGKIDTSRLFFNQCCEFRYFSKNAEKIILAIFNGEGFRLVSKPKEEENGKIVPKNKEQAFAYDLLTNHNILVVTLVGGPGTGKTLISLLAGYEQLGREYKQIIVYRPAVELGTPMGFLPGTSEKKFEPWKMPIFDNLRLIVKDGDLGKKIKEIKNGDFSKLSSINTLIEQEMLCIEPINFLQGRTLHNAFVIVDEVQNFTPQQAKAIITRIGQNSKIVLAGDITQIANPYVDEISNGLTHTIESWKGQKNFGHILLRKSERSIVAELGFLLM